jgi:hypothetical protein
MAVPATCLAQSLMTRCGLKLARNSSLLEMPQRINLLPRVICYRGGRTSLIEQ